MENEATVNDTPTTPEADDAAEELAMTGAFDAIRGNETPATAQAAADAFIAEVDKDVAAEPVANEKPTETAQAAVEALPNDEIAALKARVAEFGSLKSGLDKLAGTVGGINRTLMQLQKIQSDAPQGSLAATAARKVEAAMMKELAEDYPDIAEKLLPAFERIAGAAAPAAANEDVTALRTRLEAAEARLEKRELRELSKVHPDWDTNLIAAKDEYGEPMRNAEGKVIPSRAFTQWLASKPEEFRTEFMVADDASFVADGLTDFKTFKASFGAPATQPAAIPAPAPAPVGDTRTNNKQARLAAAVVHAGTPAAATGKPILSEEEDMERAFRSVRGK